MKRTVKVFLLLGILSAIQTHASEWIVLDDDIDIDMQSVQKEYIKGKPYVGVWTRLNNAYGVQATNLRWFNCKEKTMSELPSVSIEFDKYGNSIKQNYRELNKLKFVKIPPDVLPEKVYDISCTASLMTDVVTGAMEGKDFTEKDMAKLRKEYRQEHFINFRDFMLDLDGEQ